MKGFPFYSCEAVGRVEGAEGGVGGAEEANSSSLRLGHLLLRNHRFLRFYKGLGLFGVLGCLLVLKTFIFLRVYKVFGRS